MLVELIDALYNDIGTGLNDSTIRIRLTSIRDEAEAFEAKLKEVEAQLEELKKKPQTQKLGPDQDGLEDGAKQMLKLLFNSAGRMFLEQMASALNMAKSMADYHADILQEKGMIELAAITPAGAMFMLTAKGRRYVVENKLV
ncbi:MAG TPA: hypothetical protein VFQ43_10475 [Nitrososphaera sp.]|nr:hypothetical protein [Nitrososphaera sp.]